MSAALPPDLDLPAVVAPVRVAPRKLALRVSGAAVGSVARPSASTAGPLPTRRFGLRIHSSPLTPRPPAPAVAGVDAVPPASEYASLDDYEYPR